MILVIDNGNGSFSVYHHPEDLGKTNEELQEMGVLLDEMPNADELEGMEAILKFDGENLYYEYVEIPPSESEEIEQLKTRLEATEEMLLQIMLEGMM